MALTTLENVKAWLSIKADDTTQDTILSRLVDSCSAYIESWLNRSILLTNYTETYNGGGRQTLTLRNYPVRSVTSVSFSGVSQNLISATNYTSSGITNDSSKLIARGVYFPHGLLNVTVTYSAGYDEVPYDVEQACVEMISLRYKNMRDRIGVSSKTLAGETVTFTNADMSEATKSVLMQWKSVVQA